MDNSAAYVQPSNLNGQIKSHRSRPICKIKYNDKYILRKLKSKTIEGLDKNSLVLDHISLIELNAKNGNEVILSKANFWQRWVSYYRKNPIEDVRETWWYFVSAQFIVIVSLIIGIISLTK